MSTRSSSHAPCESPGGPVTHTAATPARPGSPTRSPTTCAATASRTSTATRRAAATRPSMRTSTGWPRSKPSPSRRWSTSPASRRTAARRSELATSRSTTSACPPSSCSPRRCPPSCASRRTSTRWVAVGATSSGTPRPTRWRSRIATTYFATCGCTQVPPIGRRTCWFIPSTSAPPSINWCRSWRRSEQTCGTTSSSMA